MSSGFVYKWIDNSNGMYYIGCHKGSIDDGYIGSGTYFLKAYNKRPEAFERQVLYVGEDFAELEEFILIELNAAKDKESYNLVNACRGQNEYTSEVRERIGRPHRGVPKKESTKKKMSIAHKGRKKSESHCKALSRALTGKTGKDARGGVSVYCAYLDKEFATIKECAEALGVSRSVVQNVFYGRTKNNKYGFKKIKK